ncbi:MAG: aminoacetone oxidase family FAD-binding enzyme [Patescibacteria group bacterium]
MKFAIVGGGAAGLMAAASALKTNRETEIFLIERNDGLGNKVIISGGGRCNVTTGITDVSTVLTNYPRGGKFLSSAMYRFPPDRVRAWFEARGVPLKVEDDLRVFPVSNDGRDIVGVFEKLFQSQKIRRLLNTSVKRIEKREQQFYLFFKDQPKPLVVDRVILTTGGQAYRHTGSKGDGYAFAQSLGHSITQLAPSLSSLFTKETWPAEVSGMSFERATIRALRDKKFSRTGPFLFTHKGISGPAAFAFSSIVAFESFDREHPLDILVDLFPDETRDDLRKTVETNISKNLKKSFTNSFVGIIPKSLSEILCDQLKIPQEKKSGEISKKDIARCVDWLKGIPMHVISKGAGDEFVTAGGVNLKEVNPTTMESKLCNGLFFAGEILDIDGFTGGFNLQASWATGSLAGERATQ